jgi:hypothetical protein
MLLTCISGVPALKLVRRNDYLGYGNVVVFLNQSRPKLSLQINLLQQLPLIVSWFRALCSAIRKALLNKLENLKNQKYCGTDFSKTCRNKNLMNKLRKKRDCIVRQIVTNISEGHSSSVFRVEATILHSITSHKVAFSY